LPAAGISGGSPGYILGLIRIKETGAGIAHNAYHPSRSKQMNLQKIFEKNENGAVAVIVIIFAIVHFGLLYLFSLT
jgi:hypothetical protein